MGPLGVVLATGLGAVAGLSVGAAADAIATPRYGPGAPGHDPEDLALALAAAPTTRRVRGAAAVATTLAFGLLAAEFADVELWAFFAALTWLYAVAAVIDLQYLRLPDVLTWPATGLALAGSFALATRYDHPEAALPGAVAAVGMAAFLWLFSGFFRILRGAEAFGLGDVKLMVSLGSSVAWLGWSSDRAIVGPLSLVIWTALAGFLIGSLAGLPAAGFKVSKHIPFGPFLMVGWFVIVLLADTL